MSRPFSSLQKPQKQLFYACLLSFFNNGALSLFIGSVLPDLRAAYGLSASFAGALLSVYSIGNLTAGLLGGIAALRFGERASIVSMSFLACLGGLTLAFCGVPGVLLFGGVLLGLGRGSVVNFSTRAVNILSDGNPTTSSLLHSAYALGAIAAPMAFLLMRGPLGWRSGLILAALLAALSTLSFSLAPMPEGGEGSSQGRGSLSFLTDPSFLILGMLMFCSLSSEYAITGWLVTYIQHKESLTASLSGSVEAYSQMMATLLWGVILAGRLACAFASRRVSPRLLLLGSSLGATAFFAGMLLGDSITLVTLCVAGLGFCMAGVSPLIYAGAAWFTNNFPLANGVLYIIGGSGGALMPFLTGWLAGRLGFGGGMAAILASFCLMILFATLHLFVRPRGVKE